MISASPQATGVWPGDETISMQMCITAMCDYMRVAETMIVGLSLSSVYLYPLRFSSSSCSSALPRSGTGWAVSCAGW